MKQVEKKTETKADVKANKAEKSIGAPIQLSPATSPLTKQAPSPISKPAIAPPIQRQLGEPLFDQLQESFGMDFSGVKIFEDSRQATELNAKAYAQGNEVHFAPGQFAPGTQEGKHLIGHEFAHVVQQRMGMVTSGSLLMKNEVINESHALEQEADRLGERFANNTLGASGIAAFDWNYNNRIIQLTKDVGPIDPVEEIDPKTKERIIKLEIDADSDYESRELTLKFVIPKRYSATSQGPIPITLFVKKTIESDAEYVKTLTFETFSPELFGLEKQHLGAAFSAYLIQFKDGRILEITNNYANPLLGPLGKNDEFTLSLMDGKNRIAEGKYLVFGPSMYDPKSTAKVLQAPDPKIYEHEDQNYPKSGNSTSSIDFSIGPHGDRYGIRFYRLSQRGTAGVIVSGNSSSGLVRWDQTFTVPIPDAHVPDAKDPFEYLAPRLVPQDNHIEVYYNKQSKSPGLYIYIETNRKAGQSSSIPTSAHRVNRLYILVPPDLQTIRQNPATNEACKDLYGQRHLYWSEATGTHEVGDMQFGTSQNFRTSAKELIVDGTKDAYEKLKLLPTAHTLEESDFFGLTKLWSLLGKSHELDAIPTVLHNKYLAMVLAYLAISENGEAGPIKEFSATFISFMAHYRAWVESLFTPSRTYGNYHELKETQRQELLSKLYGKVPEPKQDPIVSEVQPITNDQSSYTWKTSESTVSTQPTVVNTSQTNNVHAEESLPANNEFEDPAYAKVESIVQESLTSGTGLSKDQLRNVERGLTHLSESYLLNVAFALSISSRYGDQIGGSAAIKERNTTEESNQLRSEIAKILESRKSLRTFFGNYHNRGEQDGYFDAEKTVEISKIYPGKAYYYPLAGNETGTLRGIPVDIYVYQSLEPKTTLEKSIKYMSKEYIPEAYMQYSHVVCVSKKAFHKKIATPEGGNQFPDALFQSLDDNDFLGKGLFVYEFPDLGIRGDVLMNAEKDWWDTLNDASFWLGVAGMVVAFIPVMNASAPILFGLSSVAGATGHVCQYFEQNEETGTATWGEFVLTMADILMAIADIGGLIEGVSAIRRMSMKINASKLEQKSISSGLNEKEIGELSGIKGKLNIQYETYYGQGNSAKIFQATKLMDLTGNFAAYLFIAADFFDKLNEVLSNPDLSLWAKMKYLLFGLANGAIGIYSVSTKYNDWQQVKSQRAAYSEVYGKNGAKNEEVRAKYPLSTSTFSDRELTQFIASRKATGQKTAEPSTADIAAGKFPENNAKGTQTSEEILSELELLLKKGDINPKTIANLKGKYADLFLAEKNTYPAFLGKKIAEKLHNANPIVSDEALLQMIVKCKGDIGKVDFWLSQRKLEHSAFQEFTSSMNHNISEAKTGVEKLEKQITSHQSEINAAIEESKQQIRKHTETIDENLGRIRSEFTKNHGKTDAEITKRISDQLSLLRANPLEDASNVFQKLKEDIAMLSQEGKIGGILEKARKAFTPKNGIKLFGFQIVKPKAEIVIRSDEKKYVSGELSKLEEFYGIQSAKMNKLELQMNDLTKEMVEMRFRMEIMEDLYAQVGKSWVFGGIERISRKSTVAQINSLKKLLDEGWSNTDVRKTVGKIGEQIKLLDTPEDETTEALEEKTDEK